MLLGSTETCALLSIRDYKKGCSWYADGMHVEVRYNVIMTILKVG